MNYTRQIVIGTASGLAVGGFLGFIITKRVLEKKYEDIARTEIQAVKDYYKLIRKDNIRPGDLVHQPALLTDGQMDEMSEHLLELGRQAVLTQTLGYSTPPDKADDIDETPSVSEVRPEQESRKMTIEEAREIDTFDEVYQHMIANRSDKEPYILTIDEYMTDDPEYQKVSVTFYEGDDTLADDRDTVIPEVEEHLGTDALTKFGLYSKDANIVYVRNERKKMDFEVVRNMASYVEMVAGFKDPKVNRKMREDD